MVIVFDGAAIILGVLLVCALVYDLVASTRRDWKEMREVDKNFNRWRDLITEASGKQNFAEATRLLRVSNADIKKGNF